MNRFAPLFVFLPGCLCGWPDTVDRPEPVPEPNPCEVDSDLDDDGFTGVDCGGDDCDDLQPSIHPGAPEGEVAGWVVETISIGDPGRIGDVATVADESGRLHVAFVAIDDRGASTLFYGLRDGRWTTAFVDDSSGLTDEFLSSPSIAIAPDGDAILAWLDFGRRGYYGSPERGVAVASGGLGGFEYDHVDWGVQESRMDVAVAADGRMHVVYDDRGVIHAVPDGGTWDIVEVGAAGRDPSVAIDGDEIVVAYLEDAEIHLARSEVGGWETESAGNADSSTQPWVGIDGLGVTHLVFSEGGRVHHADDRGGTWSAHEEIDEGTRPTAVVDLAGTVRIAYSVGGDVRLATGREGEWQIEPVVTGSDGVAIAIAPDGTESVATSIVSCAREGACVPELVIASRGPGTGGVDRDCNGVVEDPPQCADADGDGQTAIECGGIDCDDADDGARFGGDDPFGDGIDGDCDGADGVDRDGDGSASIDAGGDDCDDRNPEIHPGAVERGDCLDWDCDGFGGGDADRDGHAVVDCGGDDCDDADAAVFLGAPDPAGDGVDQDCDEVDGVDADADGFASVASGGDDCDDAQGAIHPGVEDNPRVWQELHVEVVGGLARPSLAIDGDGVLHAAWVKGSTEEVRYGTRSGAAWSQETVDDVGEGDPDPALAIGPGDVPQIAYRENVADELRWAQRIDGDWIHESVDVTGTPGVANAMAIAADGTVEIAYVDAWDRETLEHASRSAGAWTLETIDPDGATGHDPAIALGADGAIHVVYAELGDEDLRYATNESGAWAVETVDAGADRAHFCAIALGPDGAVHVGYRVGLHDFEALTELHYATNESGAWVATEIDHGRDIGAGIGIAVVEDGSVRVAAVSDGDLAYASNESGDWVSETVVAGSYRDLSFVLDADGRAHLLSVEEAFDDLDEWTDAIDVDGVDQNCDGVDGVDADGDGHASVASGGDDCDDGDALVQACG